MRNFVVTFFALPAILFISSCSSRGKLEIKGDPTAVQLAQVMMDSLGGRAKWEKLRSVYVRTLNYVSSGDENYVLEEWIDLDKPRVMNRKSLETYSVVQILDGNEGWQIRNDNLNLMNSQTITDILDWYDHYYMRALRILATGGEDIEVKMNGFTRFDLYQAGNFLGGFEVNENKYPERYFNMPSNRLENSVIITKWGEYKGYKYPLEIHPRESLSIFKTDYWNPSESDPETAFNISYNPNIELERLK